MRLEIPRFKRCCCCLPLRHGIIVLGYLTLTIAILFIWIEVKTGQSWTESTMTLYRGVGFFTEQWLPVVLYCIEIVFILILLVGAHTKKNGLMRIYYFYGMTTTAAALAVFLLFVLNKDSHFYRYSYIDYYLIDVCTTFIRIATQVYLLLLIRSMLQKPLETLRYVNHLEEVCVQPQPGRGDGLSLL